MKAFCLTSWGDNEYFLKKEDADAACERVTKVEEADAEYLTKSQKKTKPQVYEIEVKE